LRCVASCFVTHDYGCRDTGAVIGTILSVLLFVVSLALWAIGGWQVYESNALFGAVLVLVGGLVMVCVISWWRRDEDAGLDAILHGIIEFFSRA
jgi:hypothetical protein